MASTQSRNWPLSDVNVEERGPASCQRQSRLGVSRHCHLKA
jgi:hypothetical protein